MAEAPKFNLRNPAVKRIMQEIKEIQQDTSGDFLAEALETDIFEWHFVIRGPRDTEFEGGVYHGRILLPAEYPFKPPSFMMLTPNGRFETNMKICLSISSHHPEHWQPSWSVRTALMAMIGFMPSPGAGALGALDFPKEDRRVLAAKSRHEPPRFGSAERQRVIDHIHARMLELQERLLQQEKQAAAEPSGGPATVQGEDAGAQHPQPQQEGPAQAAQEAPSAAPAGRPGPAAPAPPSPKAAPAAPSLPAPSPSPAVAPGSLPQTPSKAAAAQPATVPSPAASPARPAAAAAASPARPPAAPAIRAHAPAVVPAAAGPAVGTTDHMLTALMWALYVGIGAILLRKVMGVMGVDVTELLQQLQLP